MLVFAADVCQQDPTADASGSIQQSADTTGRSIDDIRTTKQRVDNHQYSKRSKALRVHVLPKTHIVVGDLVCIYGDRNKSRARDIYLVASVDGVWCLIRKCI